ncbi:28S ribosomal protein S7, mitochondrial [Copidosoma floridanum]|uniref:28S ribosomal protein S7, mitochondrial n=1 Tax=Copidosoma floridanum TaxID=29053 RepID=UPI0006C97339|nr:28S ribosomal protein S7, mitochondrial [Copidosoma floridanum]
MAPFRTLAVQFNNLINVKQAFRISSCERFYSVFPKQYVQPVFEKNVQAEMEKAGELQEIKHLPIKPAFTPHTSSEFYDPIVNQFINYLTKEGNKKRAREILKKAFEIIKRAQIQTFHKADPEKQNEIELDPKVILYKAIENCSPVLELARIKRGGITYQVPVPLTNKRSKFLAMKWLIQSADEKEMTVKIWEKLAYELIDAHKNMGRVVRKKQELYRQCEANRSFAHFRWT